MVNLGKRMRNFKPLLKIRSGAGAAIIPSPSTPSAQPILTDIHLRFPYGPFDTAIHGARLFWRNHLRRLKFHNPALPITVEHGAGNLGSPMTLRLTFEGTDVDALKAIAQKSETPKHVRRMHAQNQVRESTPEELEEAARKQSPNWREHNRNDQRKEVDPTAATTEVEEGGLSGEKKRQEADPTESTTEAEEGADTMQEAERKEPAEPTTSYSSSTSSSSQARSYSTTSAPSREGVPTASDDEVTLKQPEPTSPSPDSAKCISLPPIYTRTTTLNLKDRTPAQIWFWFKQRTHCTDVPRSAEDEKEIAELAGIFGRAGEDRIRVKKGVDEKRANEEMLRRARGELEELRSEA